MSNLTPAEQSRFDSKWEKRGDCHVWTGPLDPDGYGVFFLRRRGRRAARVAWYAANGEIAPGSVVNHSCRNRACVNFQHLGVMTPGENTMRDSNSVGYVNSRKTTCPQGHPYDKTVVWSGQRQRVCSQCANAKAKRLRAKWRAEDTLRV